MTAGQGQGGQDGARGYPGPMAYAGIGMLNALCLLGCGALGWLADSNFGTLPVFLLVGLLVGAALGIVATRAELRRYRLGPSAARRGPAP
jgi:hypothetical protein